MIHIIYGVSAKLNSQIGLIKQIIFGFNKDILIGSLSDKFIYHSNGDGGLFTKYRISSVQTLENGKTVLRRMKNKIKNKHTAREVQELKKVCMLKMKSKHKECLTSASLAGMLACWPAYMHLSGKRILVHRRQTHQNRSKCERLLISSVTRCILSQNGRHSIFSCAFATGMAAHIFFFCSLVSGTMLSVHIRSNIQHCCNQRWESERTRFF